MQNLCQDTLYKYFILQVPNMPCPSNRLHDEPDVSAMQAEQEEDFEVILRLYILENYSKLYYAHLLNAYVQSILTRI